jgi:hypothetical protein
MQEGVEHLEHYDLKLEISLMKFFTQNAKRELVVSLGLATSLSLFKKDG